MNYFRLGVIENTAIILFQRNPCSDKRNWETGWPKLEEMKALVGDR